MTQNRIRTMRAAAGISAATLAGKLPDIASGVAMSFVERGQVLPTKDALAAMCELFDCKPEELYAVEDIDLCGALRSSKEHITTYPIEGDTELHEAIKGLGYMDTDEWLRDMRRRTIAMYVLIARNQTT